ncbi:MAG: hypothetical protein HKO96_00335 [Flavobacteriaceae bacterium]|nr:hypothetical protein [Flavobacteriaceae bacterium]
MNPKEEKHIRIAFLYLDEIHHVNHFISIAVELSKLAEVTVLTHPNCQDYFFESLRAFKPHEVRVEIRKTSAFRAFTDRLKNRVLPRKGFWIKKNLNYIFQNFDAVIFTDYFQRYFLEARGNKKMPKLLKIPHGPPGRHYSYREDQREFDFQVLLGPFHEDQLLKKHLLAEHYAVVGYPKFDAVKTKVAKPVFDNNKPVVLYNPHFSPPQSSWHKEGLKVLEFFYIQNDFNLIFAPHVNLFTTKGGESSGTIPAYILEAEHIHIDLGSEKCVDMTYTTLADIYVGDVSSQVYEFIPETRPCIFINSEGIDYKDQLEYRFWRCGQVIEKIEELKGALNQAFILFEEFKSEQQEIDAENFLRSSDQSASEKAANAIYDYLCISIEE